VLKALEAPIRQIAENAGVEGSIVVGNVLAEKSQTYGFDAQMDIERFIGSRDCARFAEALWYTCPNTLVSFKV
jgi:hypothetical protein